MAVNRFNIRLELFDPNSPVTGRDLQEKITICDNISMIMMAATYEINAQSPVNLSVFEDHQGVYIADGALAAKIKPLLKFEDYKSATHRYLDFIQFGVNTFNFNELEMMAAKLRTAVERFLKRKLFSTILFFEQQN